MALAGLQVFAQTHIPRALEEVDNHEEDYDRLAEGKDVEGIYYQTITGMRQNMTGARSGPAFTDKSCQVDFVMMTHVPSLNTEGDSLPVHSPQSSLAF